MSNTKQGHELYGHAQYADARIIDTKTMYGQYRKAGFTHKGAVQRVSDSTGYDVRAICSMVAKKKVSELKVTKELKDMTMHELVHECYKEMVKINRPGTEKRHIIMDVCDRTRLDYATVCKYLEEDVLVQLTLF